MLEARTRDFGAVPYEDTDVIDFVRPLPGFPGQHRFLMIRPRQETPWIVLQSLDEPATALLTLPVGAIDGGYEVRLAGDDAEVLGWRDDAAGALVLVTVAAEASGTATANLAAPIIIDARRRRAIQAIRDDRRYSPAAPLEDLLGREEVARCS